MEKPPFIRSTWRMFSGAIVWAAHFGAIYTFTALACARGLADARWLGVNIVTLAVLVMTMLALGAVFAGARPALREGRASFENWMGAGVSGLAAIAIAWEGLMPVFIVPACG